MNSWTRIKFLKTRFRFQNVAWFNSMCISIFNCNPRIAFHYKSILIFKTLQWLTFKLLLAHSLKQNNIPKLTSSMDYATFIGMYLRKCSKSALIKFFIHTFLMYSFLHILLHCAFILQRDVNIKSKIAFWLIILKSAPPPELRWVGSFCEEGPSVRPTDHSRRTEPSLEHCAAAPAWPHQVQCGLTCGISGHSI